ncbi:MAG TPA: N-acetylmuramoyl-L-alanine amidase-like domain-containing protein [Anaeromyxobacteraceae bacterium]|nr:N-acetylmuramoyl-L-alanine amidase-like domain-containing protein [Anaeromyxobacteraceae bacterium]
MAIHPAALVFLLVASREAALDAGLGAHDAGAPRAVWASGLLLGAPYRVSPLGEGGGIDPDPRFRLDAFDCVTLVETAIALGSSRSVAEARVLLDDLRYDGPPDFQHRNHYLEAQWLVANARKGWIEDVTPAIGGAWAMVGEKRLTPGTWRAAERAGRTIPGLAPESRPMGRFRLPLVPVDHVPAIAPRIPEGTLLLVVREDRPWRPYRVTHLGIMVVGPRGERLLRHASDVPGVMRVRDESLLRFLARNAGYQGWPVVGVSLWAIRDGAARARDLLR